MSTIWANQALLPQGWAEDVHVDIHADGRIQSVHAGPDSKLKQRADQKVGLLLPAPVNVHSHGFQRAMAGLTEARGSDPHDSFWTWRQLMYRFLAQLTPDHVEAITSFAQMEMLEAGYGSVSEFHYMHHQPSGVAYDNPAEMAERIMAAAAHSGIGLTLLPVLYQYGGCGKQALSGPQLRFGNDGAAFGRLFETLAASAGRMADSVLGLAVHSLRAVAPGSIADLAILAGGRPVHMHLAEQTGEVEDVKAHLGSRPAEWLLDNAPLGGNWCLVHSTHLEPHETHALAKTGAVAGLCPITEASLGDGIFEAARWLGSGGQIAIGTDSNIRISLTGELRLLEYSQRLRDRSRAVLATSEKSTGRRLFDAIVSGGARAAGRDTGAIRPAAWADLLAIDDLSTDLIGRSQDQLLDSYIFSGGDCLVTDVWSAGRHMVHGGRHVRRSEIESRYREAMTGLGELL